MPHISWLILKWVYSSYSEFWCGEADVDEMINCLCSVFTIMFAHKVWGMLYFQKRLFSVYRTSDVNKTSVSSYVTTMWEETGGHDNSVPCFGRCPHVVVANISPHFSPSLSCYQSLQQQKFSLDVSDNTTDGKMSWNTSFSWNIKPNFLWSIQKRINPPGWTIRMMKTPRAKIEMKTNHMIYCIQIKNISDQFKFINIEWEKQGASTSFIL